ncbi:MAG: N-6 DNA methylase [Clostridiales bacterium]
MSLAKIIYDNTTLYLDTASKAERKKIGQFFTPASIAEHMAGLSRNFDDSVFILDPGAGSGILSAAMVDTLITKNVKKIYLDAYENNSDILPLLKENLTLIQQTARDRDIELYFNIFEKNFIVENQFAWTGLIPNQKYDIVIANPPYKKISKNDVEANIMLDIVYGQPNLYFLFMAMGTQLLKDGGECIYIVPRSFSSGLYFTAFRNHFLNIVQITNLHLFVSRESVGGSKDKVLQETIILRATKANTRPNVIQITQSSNESCCITNHFSVQYETCVKNNDNSFLFFPTSAEDSQILDFVNQWPSSLPELGYRMKTGIVVDFRETLWMRTDSSENVIPLLWAYNFHENRIRFPVKVEGKPQYLYNGQETNRLKMQKGNYLLLKRFTSKEERKRLQCALLLEEDFSSYDSISTENHLNFITKINGRMSKEEVYGLFVVLNSSYMDKYFRILNGSTQVNANEINALPFPTYNDLVQMGRSAMQLPSLTHLECDNILESRFLPTAISQAI